MNSTNLILTIHMPAGVHAPITLPACCESRVHDNNDADVVSNLLCSQVICPVTPTSMMASGFLRTVHSLPDVHDPVAGDRWQAQAMDGMRWHAMAALFC